ncbi:ImmA/IrrE family metallo-endopeptidase [Lactococcus lactis]|uniref:ImmA/IrrE family metallo-endopeptidase n=1 Tax=Lactococcus lactis TaxID=1358 RepID=UPI0015D5A721|nr:ImmA/IrrE family metallo-endopeptidase [Lactococcus lactis]
MTDIEKPDFEHALLEANKLLIQDGLIETFPFQAKKIVKSCSGMSIQPYKKAIEKYGFNPKDLGSQSALTVSKWGRKLILYNNEEYKPRVIWSILHELGHDRLNHPLNPEQYSNKEIEAHFFAAQLLMPEQLILELIRRGEKVNSSFLQEKFGVSSEAAEKRLKTMNRVNWEWRSEEEKFFDEYIVKKFETFLSSIHPRRPTFDEDYEQMEADRMAWRI